MTFVADRYYPYNSIPNSPNPGYMVEIAQHAMAKAGHTVKYQLMSWDRAVQQVELGEKNCVIAAYKSDAPNLLFPQVSQGIDQVGLFQRAGSPWRFESYKSLEQVKLGIIDDYAYTGDIDLYIEKFKGTEKIVARRGKFALEHNIKALVDGELDVVMNSKPVVLSALKKLNLEDEVEFVGAVDEVTKIYLACSPALESSKEYVQLISETTDELRASGELVKILARYGLADWQGSGAVDN